MSEDFGQISVIKRDGKKERYNPDKIIQVAEAAGLEVEKAVKLAQSINEWVSGLKKTKITSLELRDQVQKFLRGLNPRVADLYQWYQKTKELKPKK